MVADGPGSVNESPVLARSQAVAGRLNQPGAHVLLILALSGLAAAQPSGRPPNVLPASAVGKLAASFDAAGAHRRHAWRDTPPTNADETVNAYIEIPMGERRKFEFVMRGNTRGVDRVMPAEIGGYPINYGFVPQTISYDGDPFDVLVLGPALPGGRIVRGRIVGLMLMEDEKGIDSKVVLSPVDRDGRSTHALTPADRDRVGRYFDNYKRQDPKAFSSVPGWSTPEDGLAHIVMTHAFFRQCRGSIHSACRIDP
jgi:inorganic pyrophosphatase